MLSVRELKESDIKLIADYWYELPGNDLHRMGVDPAKMIAREELIDRLSSQLALPLEERATYCIIWLDDGVPIGHCNTNPIDFGNEAKMHLHIWPSAKRKKGLGTRLVKMTVPLFFKNLKLKRLICEPRASNQAPNRTLQRVGFQFEKEYLTVPGPINMEQRVKRWVLDNPD